MASKQPTSEKLAAKIVALEVALDKAMDGADTTLMATTVAIKGIEELLYATKAQFARVTGNDRDAIQWHRAERESAETKTKAARALAADEAQAALEDEEHDAETRRMVLALVK